MVVRALAFALELRGRVPEEEKPWNSGRLSFMEDELDPKQLKKARLSLRKGEVPETVSARLSGREEELHAQKSFKGGIDFFTKLMQTDEEKKKREAELRSPKKTA